MNWNEKRSAERAAERKGHRARILKHVQVRLALDAREVADLLSISTIYAGKLLAGMARDGLLDRDLTNPRQPVYLPKIPE